MRRLLILPLLFAFTLIVSSVSAQQGTLTLETLQGSPTEVTLTTTCNSNGSGTINFEAEGIAIGPYAGTFRETGQIVLGQELDSTGHRTVEEFRAEFHIDSPGAQVDGRKFIDFGVAQAACGGFPNFPNVFVTALVVRYEAIVRPATGGAFYDEGEAVVYIGPVSSTAGAATLVGAAFTEFFVSDGIRQPLFPSTKEECKSSGFEIFNIFKNQGDCVSFIETDRKNEPGDNLAGVP